MSTRRITKASLAILAAAAATQQHGVGIVSALSTRNSVRTHLPRSSSSTTTTPAAAASSLLCATSDRSNASGTDHGLHSATPGPSSDNGVVTETRRNGYGGCGDGAGGDDDTTGRTTGATVQNRKQALRSISVLAAGLLSSSAAAVVVLPTPEARAFDRSFPTELAGDDDDDNKTETGGGVLVGRRSTAAQRKLTAEANKRSMDQNLADFSPRTDALPSLTWALALFFASGSRSNPLATPLANLVYGYDANANADATADGEEWLRDRNAGLFGPLPLPFLGLLGLVFLLLGTITQYALLQLSDGDSVVCGQLAGVALINGGFFEIGRIASGEKRPTRDENDRAVMLEAEFDEFARKRIVAGGNCHRSDVVRSFRRFNPKYRQADSTVYPLTDREIEQLLKVWNKTKNGAGGGGGAEMSSSGFYYGIQINKDADVFA